MKRVLVLTGDGINCEQESARAFRDAGAEVSIIHVNTLLSSHDSLKQADILCFPGGFSFGDELKSGKILAEKMREALLPEMETLLRRGGLMIGICNGFQILMQLGMFEKKPALNRTLTLTTNAHQEFRDFWVECRLGESARRSPWFREVQSSSLFLPVRHKEGRILGEPPLEQTAISYVRDINGSQAQIAGVLDVTGQVLGLMPHPEAATEFFLNPLDMPMDQKARNAQAVRQIFLGAVKP